MIKKAQINEQNEVINIALFPDDSINEGWIQYNDANPAYIGGDYVDGFFYPPQPFASWIRNEGKWVAPISKPDGIGYFWDEQTLNWIKI